MKTCIKILKTWGAKIKNYIGGELVDYNYSPYRYSGSLAFTEMVMSGGMAYGEYLAKKFIQDIMSGRVPMGLVLVFTK